MQSLVTPVLPTIQHDLHTSAGTVTWVVTSWLLAASVGTPLLGRIGDLSGKQRTLMIALACIVGPFFTGHPFDRVYPDYVKVPASLVE